ncbi:hypothetical protein JCM3766R1_006136 [Sporobolomyces carnicolor]
MRLRWIRGGASLHSAASRRDCVRSVSTTSALYATSNGAAKVTSMAARDSPKIMLDEYGRERRPLPPLASLAAAVEPETAPREVPVARLKRTVRRTSVTAQREPPQADPNPELGSNLGQEIASSDKKKKKKEKKDKVVRDDKDNATMSVLEASVRKDLETYPDAILLTQVGSFFESYFDQARTVSSTLGIKLTSKLFGRGVHRTREPFCGFPISHLKRHVSTLVEHGHKVVIVEEFKEAGATVAATTVTRRVTRIVTPGTGVDEAFVDLDAMNFVLAIGAIEPEATTTTAATTTTDRPAGDPAHDDDAIGLAYRDISTGASFTRVSTLASLRDDLQLVNPREVVIDERLEQTRVGTEILGILNGERLRESLMVSTVSTNAIPSSSRVVASARSNAEDVLLAYLAATLVDLPAPPRSTRTKFVDPAEVMQLDSVTLKSLEVRESLRGGLKGSLVHAVKRTVTPGGTRLLTERLTSPSTNLDEVHARLELVSVFLNALPHSRSYVRAILRTLDDTPRLLQRLYLQRGSAFDLLGLKKTMRALDTIRQDIDARIPPRSVGGGAGDDVKSGFESRHQVDVLVKAIDKLGQFDALALEIEMAIDEDALMRRTRDEERKAMIEDAYGERHREREEEEETAVRARGDGLWGDDQTWVIKQSFSRALERLHDELKRLRDEAYRLQTSLRERYESRNLTLKVLPKIGAAAHVLTRDGVVKLEADERAHLYQKSNSTRAYVLRDWTLLWKKLEAVSSEIERVERDTISILTARVLDNYDRLLATSDALAELDVAIGFAELAQEKHWTKPLVDSTRSLEIVKGRHPTVETALLHQNREFTANSVTFRHPHDDHLEGDTAFEPSFIHVLTGPNMAGKSTFLRQTALITILAQAGSYVPAERARVGVCDRVFSRVGARDELDRDRSTFMIEMDEATTILAHATSRSLVLFDELGRGTSPIDGVAIAFAALEHLLQVNACRTLFATHYHRLGDLLGYDESDAKGTGQWRGVEFWCTDVEEDFDSVRYVHEIRRGLNKDSAGLVIARLAGMPPRAIATAKQLRDKFLAGLV